MAGLGFVAVPVEVEVTFVPVTVIVPAERMHVTVVTVPPWS